MRQNKCLNYTILYYSCVNFIYRSNEREKSHCHGTDPSSGPTHARSQLRLWSKDSGGQYRRILPKPAGEKCTVTVPKQPNHLIREKKKIWCRHQCPHCFRSYSQKASLQRHVRMKHEGGIMDCGVCKLSFTSRYRYRKHIKTQHMNLAH